MPGEAHPPALGERYINMIESSGYPHSSPPPPGNIALATRVPRTEQFLKVTRISALKYIHPPDRH